VLGDDLEAVADRDVQVLHHRLLDGVGDAVDLLRRAALE
jgi:hypothetical protein